VTKPEKCPFNKMEISPSAVAGAINLGNKYISLSYDASIKKAPFEGFYIGPNKPCYDNKNLFKCPLTNNKNCTLNYPYLEYKLKGECAI
jgi:hypothetical protein